MTDVLIQRVQGFIYQEEQLLSQVNQIQQDYSHTGNDVATDLFAKGVSKLVGRTAGKYTRRALSESRKQFKAQKEAEIATRHQGIVSNLKNLLAGVSEYKQNLSEPNTNKLIAQVDKAQEGVRVVTRINATLRVLRSFQNKKFVNNDQLPLKKSKEVLIEAGTPFSSYIEFSKLLSCVSGYVKIIDPYVDVVTLERLLCVPSSVQLKLLTMNTGGEKKERRLVRMAGDFKVEKPLFEMRKTSGLHDRFLIFDGKACSLGCSINGLGKKMSMINPVSESVCSDLESKFDEIWRKAIVII